MGAATETDAPVERVSAVLEDVWHRIADHARDLAIGFIDGRVVRKGAHEMTLAVSHVELA